ncbi:hypothetical protein BDV26DRAFT_257118 [Aspergillus bertholletiae]|uniref:Uncharacterized protein n=1 Tax=Aspergillus bertholletiae TaxID=1226010 RepID=A0A5N7BFV5_9EURO|nr:hypothetical protein BDV26DRAFT_257118 [Aspergillus bertholletiae]
MLLEVHIERLMVIPQSPPAFPVTFSRPLATMGRAVVALTAPDLLPHASAGGSSLCAVDDIPLGVSAAAVILVEVLRAHLEDLRLVELNRVDLLRENREKSGRLVRATWRIQRKRERLQI